MPSDTPPSGFTTAVTVAGPGRVRVSGIVLSGVPVSVQIPPASQASPASRANVIASPPAGASQKIHARSSPSSVWRATPWTVPPVTATDGVVFLNVATGSLNATITCGRSPAPLCSAEENRLCGYEAANAAALVLLIVPTASPSRSSAPVASLKLRKNVSPSSSSVSTRISKRTVADTEAIALRVGCRRMSG